MTEAFEPRNDLERELVAAQEGKIAGDVFMQGLLSAQVFMPVRDDTGIKNFQRNDRATPLTVETEDGVTVLVLFTSPERAKPFVQNFPGYQGGLLAEFSWVLEKVGGGFGIALNPGWQVGMDMEPDMVQRLAQAQS